MQMELVHIYIPMDFNSFSEHNIITTAQDNNCCNRSKKYFSADLNLTQGSFANLHKLFLSLKESDYSGETCVISLQTQKEIISEVCQAAEWENFKSMSIQEKFKSFPIVGRTVYLDVMKRNDLTDGLAWKFFYLQVRSLPKVHCISNTQNLSPFIGYRDERWNCILPTYQFDKSAMTDTEVKSVKQVMNHAVSSLIMNSHEFFIPDMIVIVSASVLEHLLKHTKIDGYIRKDLDLVEYLVDFYGSKKWKKYQEMSTDTAAETFLDWKKGLVTEVGVDFMKCEHVKKFVLAWFMKARKQGHAVTGPILKTVTIQCIVEAVGRIYASTRNRVKPLSMKRMAMPDIHRRIIASKFNYVSVSYHSYHRKEFCASFRREALSVMEGLSDDYINTLHGIQKTTTMRINQAVEDLCRSFENIAILAGMDPAVVTMTESEICACLHYAFKIRSSWERNEVVHAESVIGRIEKDLFGLAMDGDVDLRDKFVKDVLRYVPKEWGKFYDLMAEGRHDRMPFPVPLDYCKRLLNETGYDFEKKARVDPVTRLPRLACAHPRCYFFMKVARNRRELQRHLKCASHFTVPGFHKVVSDLKYREDVEGAIQAIKAGEALKMPKKGELYLADLVMSIMPAVENGAKVRCIHSVDDYFRKIVEEGLQSYASPACTYEEFKSAATGSK